MATDWQGFWDALNERQKHFLTVLFTQEQGRAAYYNSQKAMFDPLKKGAEWRWMEHNPIGGRGLQELLTDNNQGTGSTCKALEERGYIARRWKPVSVFSLMYGEKTVQVLSVQLTAHGRRLIKTIQEKQTGAEEVAAQRLTALLKKASGKALGNGHTLRPWEDNPDGVSIAICKLCGSIVRVSPTSPAKSKITGAAAEQGCGGWQSNPASPERLRAQELGLDRLRTLMQERRGEQSLRDVAQTSGVSASTILRVEHGKLPGKDEYCLLCRWAGMEPQPWPSSTECSPLESCAS